MKAENLKLITDLRHQLHAHPELSTKEVWTKRHLIDFLKANTTHLEIVELPEERWFYAFYHKEGATKTIGIRADFDALPMEERLPDLPHASQCPGVSHKCGHDGHAAALAGLALELDQQGSNKNVLLLFQHAEETGEGAVECVELLSTLHIDEFYAFHNITLPRLPKDCVVLRSGTMQCASVGMTIEMLGSPAHASQPEDGRNPANAISQLVCSLHDLADPAKYIGLVLCTVVQIDVGQRAFGMSASRGEVSITVRAEHQEEFDALLKKIEVQARALAAADGLTCSVSFAERFPETYNDSACADKVRAAARSLNLPIREMEGPMRGSEDFGHILNVIPGAAFQIGNGVGYPALHTYEFDFNDKILNTAVEMYKAILAR